MTEEKPLVSVIIPAYRAEETIEKCLLSVLSQDYKNIEVILIDDGSPDGTGRIADDIAAKDKRLKVIHRENGGVSAARNTGLSAAAGRFIAFVDADDRVDENYIGYMYSLLMSNGADIASCGVTNVTLGGRVVPDVYDGVIVMDKKEALERMCYNDRFYVTLWDKLYKKELFDGIRFDEGKLFEDTGTTYKVVMKSEKTVYGGECRYYYLNKKESITTSVFALSKLDYIEMADRMADDIEKEYPDLKKACDRKRLHALFSTLVQLAISGERRKDIEKTLLLRIKEIRRGVFFDRRAPKRDKAAILSLLFGYRFFSFAWRLYAKFGK